MKIQHLALALVLGLSACSGGSSDPKALNDSGFKKLAAADYEGAKSDFESAAGAMTADMSDSNYRNAKLGIIEAMAYLDGERAKDDFLTLAGANELTASEYGQIGGVLVSANSSLAGLSVVHAGLQKFEDDAKLSKLIDAIKEKANSDPAVASGLSGLGYI